ncbi:MAG: glycosyltransferase [Campylobacterota bacterium]|nr:glycosyltransferase [Campylobacterota bacterium]
MVCNIILSIISTNGIGERIALINGFDELAYLKGNPDIAEAINDGDIEDIQLHFEEIGLADIREGLRKYHYRFEPFNESLYLEMFPDIKEAIEKGLFSKAFQHFYANGYKEIIEGSRPWTEINMEQISKNEKEAIDIDTGIEQLENPNNFINGFDEDAYLKGNPDIEDIQLHFEEIGLADIREGLRKFHYRFEPFNESLYLEMFPDIKEAIEKGLFPKAFQHFYANGYKEIIEGSRPWPEVYGENSEVDEIINKAVEPTPEKVIVVLGVPRSGLTMMTSLLGGNSDATAWFLPYSTRSQENKEPFKDFASLKKAYSDTFPNEEPMKNTVIISATTADLNHIELLLKSLYNLEEKGVQISIIWMVRDIHHTYISQMETAFKYWGGTEPVYNKETYTAYVNFVKNSYLKLVEFVYDFDTALVEYEGFLKSPEENLKSIYDWIGIDCTIFDDDLRFESKHIAGDPSFQCDLILKEQALLREEKWSKITSLEGAIDPLLQNFIDFQQERKEILFNNPVPYSFDWFQRRLFEKHFDKEYYFETYEDIQKSGMDPIEHYLTHGWRENRNPNAEFETKWYRENVFDDDETPSFLHYLLVGRFKVELEHEHVGIMENLKIIDPETYEITDDLILEAPKFKSPKVSIIVPAYNEEQYTMACIESIIENTEEGVSYEIIVMDDKSPDESARLIERNLKNVKFITNGINYGFLMNCNKGATFAIGEYLLFLNNDTNVQPGWLSSLVELIESADDIGMVGSRLVYPTGQQQEAGGIIWDDASGWNFGRLGDPSKPEFNYVKEADYLTGAAMMIRTSLWEEIGGFDTRYIPAYYEDTDLAFEARRHGYRTLYQPKSVVIHFEGISHGTDLGSGIKKYQVVNKENFFNKWKEVLQGEQFPNAQEVFLARDRSAKKRHLLYVDYYLPHYDQDAGSKATFQYLKILAENNIQVHFVGDNFYDYPDTPYLDALQQMGIEVLHGNWYAKHFKKWYAKHGKYFDYAVLSRPHIAVKYVDIIRDYSDAKIIYMGHDLHFLREQREYKIKGDHKYLESSQRWQESEMDLIHRCDVAYFFSGVEKEEILKIDTQATVDVVPLYIYDHFKEITVSSSNRQDIMFVGGFGHSPNVDAMLWFVSEIWPIILKNMPEVKLYIIGSKVPEEIVSLASQSVIVTGYVDDDTLDAFYAKCKVVVAPLRYGAGIKGKIVDALYNGMPIVTTSIGAEGLVDSSEIMVIADKSEKFAQDVLTLYNDDALADTYAQNALTYCKEYFSVKMAKDKMSNIFQEFKEKGK